MEDKEYTVTISLDEYKDLIRTQIDCGNLIDYIFGVANYDDEFNSLELDDQAMYLINIYMKNIWDYNYQKALKAKKNKALENESKLDQIGE